MRTATVYQVNCVRNALDLLREARTELSKADAPRALAKVRKAIKSAEGAERHVLHRYRRAAP